MPINDIDQQSWTTRGNQEEELVRSMEHDEHHHEEGLGQEAQRTHYDEQYAENTTTVCPHCGAVNEREAMFCLQCGEPLRSGQCPFCGAPMELDEDFCENCHQYVKSDVCSFCGAHIEDTEPYCQVCGSPRDGIVCPVCHTIGKFAFCTTCGTALTAEAKMLEAEMKSNPEYRDVMKLAEELAQIDNIIPVDSADQLVRDEKNRQFAQHILELLEADMPGKKLTSENRQEQKRMTKDEYEHLKEFKRMELNALMEKLKAPAVTSPAKARNYAMASRPQSGIRVGWECNWKHALHSSPCGCAKPQCGGKWVVIDKNNEKDIKNDK